MYSSNVDGLNLERYTNYIFFLLHSHLDYMLEKLIEEGFENVDGEDVVV